MEFIVITEATTNQPRIIAVRQILMIGGDASTPPKAVFMLSGGSVITTTHNAQDILTRALTKGVAADLRS
jgi:hypothetical protein